MRGLIRVAGAFVILLLAAAGAAGKPAPFPPDDRNSVVIVFQDGHRQSFAMAEIARLDFKAPAVIVFKDGHQEKLPATSIARIEFESSALTAMTPGRAHFLGKWEVGDGNGNRFFITLEEDGDAKKSLGSSHGTWTVVDGEARISWDDGWHDVIRKVGHPARKARLRTRQILRRRALQRDRRQKHSAQTDLASCDIYDIAEPAAAKLWIRIRLCLQA